MKLRIGLDLGPRRMKNQHMKKFSTNLNVLLLSGLFTAALLTWLGPKVIGLLFTPPVSFGTNCEPAAAWSMQKLIWTQFIGLILGALGAGVFVATRKGQAEKVNAPSKEL